MNWESWVGKEKVFILLDDGGVFSNSKILLYEEPFLSLTDRDGLPAVINVKTIIKIKEEKNG